MAGRLPELFREHPPEPADAGLSGFGEGGSEVGRTSSRPGSAAPSHASADPSWTGFRHTAGEHAGSEKGDLTGPNPVDRGKYGSKIHLITERSGLPISVGISGANLHDSQALIPLVKGIPPIRSRRGRRRRKPGKLHAAKGYDSAHLRRWLRERGITHRIARKGVESSQRLGRHRWTVERTMAWLAGCRRLHRRYERKADHFLAFTSIACTLICYRRLTK
ncbi:IS5 family transposase [Streptomyces bacillaris]|uniref:IS5 family transposase n=1 Tax=Streptomyces bacillaris TaxID=68179 RepID=UPI0038265D9F